MGGRPAKLNEKKGDRDLEREIKNKGDDISSIKRVTRKFLEVSRCIRAKKTAKKWTKKVCCTSKVAFSN